MGDTLEDRLASIISAMLELDETEVNQDTSSLTVEKWDSLAQMNIVMAVEEEFGMRFTDEQIVESLSYAALLSVVLGAGQNG